MLRIHNPGKHPEVRQCIALSTNGEAMFIGQLVTFEGAGNTAVVRTAGHVYQPGELASIAVVADGATAKSLGVVVGIEQPLGRSVVVSRVASVERVISVAICDENTILEVPGDSSGSPAATMVGANCNFVNNNTGSVVTGFADTKLDESTPAADATYQGKIVGLRGGFTNNARDSLAVGCVWLVKMNLRVEANAIAGV